MLDRPEIRLNVFKSEAKSFDFQLLDNRTREGISLTGKTVRFTVREEIGDASAKIAKATGSGIVHANQTTNPGEFTLSISASDNDLVVTEHVWDLWVDDELYVAPSVYEVSLSVRQP